MEGYLVKKKFSEIDLSDSFFDSLKSDYSEFEDWFKRKNSEEAYLLHKDCKVEGFLYFKIESGTIKDITPHIECNKALKIGTMKINPHKTRLGERFIKKALDHALVEDVDVCYVTVFDKHQTLVNLFKKYGFTLHGTKDTQNGQELVLVKNLNEDKNDIILNYPLISTYDADKYILAIYPEYHSSMFPDSILNNESVDILEDVSYTNSIHKIYVTRMPVNRASRGDIFVMYRTADKGKTAEYSSVVTSVCVVEEVKSQNEFADFEEFYTYATKYSIFDRSDLELWYRKGKCFTVKMTYNAALSRRLIRQKLIDNLRIGDRQMRWSFFELTDGQFRNIIEEGGISERIIID
ncbi:hypothetical protein DFQ01_12121 [Paenibacillus cellulosilyticus]|uniref:Acetyltransferase (GNAT) family protein n=1 Tax=Paenibacillus cellulosilyticus TaxID=375489 RepID=A0A2V2YP15_9BACL|nr:N-acetyltransferase [Paenibacillus cellulosilyticus]PWV97379.1 hypothetical protein DFQ01_12121 [Paenibacillus cellulosilyticus]QKS48577.1 N-acetyltransferase [Paenibacillus cellulosilyticus]